ncbi:MAG: hypothetical protein IJS99_06355 [Synergistaceae bacterium]|nr:hypothetical protein [Synergistaceae bacterium]
MQTLNTSGKSGLEAVEIVKAAINENANENELKILIDGPAQSDKLMRFLENEGDFNSVTLEDDEGTLYIIASGRQIEQQENESGKILLAPIEASQELQELPAPEIHESQEIQPVQELTQQKNISLTKNVVIQDSLAIILSYENKKYRAAFMQKFIHALTQAKIKPSIIALLDNAVNLAVYNSKTCKDLKILESSGVNVLISDSCADRLGVSEALGAGLLTDMSEILEKIFSCEKLLSL